MRAWFEALSPVTQAFLAGLFTWGITAIGAALVFVTQRVNQRLLDAMLGFAAGVMTAASYWSLLAPAIEIAGHRGGPAWLPPLAGFVLGGGVLWGIDKVLPHLHTELPLKRAEGLATGWNRAVLLVLAITLHNIPEGLAVGVAFGGTVAGIPGAGLGAAVALAVGIGIQNFPEGVAVAMPLRAEGMSARRCFWFGQLSAAVEPVAAIVGAAAVIYAAPILPYALAFAAGAMLYVVVEELIPTAHAAGNADTVTLSFLAGFSVMMTLDVALG
jgi:ZIP family zinc transporter